MRASRIFRFLKSNPKLFFIGFNKCGTTSLHRFMKANGYLSLHHSGRVLPTLRRVTIATTIKENVAHGRAPLRGLARFRVFSDIGQTKPKIIEGNAYFCELHRAYQDAYFVLNTRPVENWLHSRSRHKNGAAIARQAAMRGISSEELLKTWRKEHDAFLAEATAYFAENPRFLVFDIEQDPISRLVEALAPGFCLDPAIWHHHNRSDGKFRRLAG